MTADVSLSGTAQQPSDAEAARRDALARYDILDAPRDDALDRIAALAARLLGTPIATVSIVGGDRIWFKATYGLDGLTQVAREPGLCASAILHNGPYVVGDALTDQRTAANSLVHGETGVRFYAAAPITTVDGHRLGTVDVLDTRPRGIDDAAKASLVDLAAVVMDELELRLAESAIVRRERHLRQEIAHYASTLQQTLLPPSLPTVDGLELAGHYHAAERARVTGDFYDVFPLGDGRWAFCLGDVAGHGAPAAVVTSLARFTLRTAALHTADPAAALDELNTVLLRDPNVRKTCTVLFGILAPYPAGGVDVTLASGGHPPALWLRPGRGSTTVEQIWPAGGMLLGAFQNATFATRRVRLRPGQSLLLHTDGLTEARPGGEFFGDARLRTFLASRSVVSADRLVAEIGDLIAGFDPAPDDDVALLVLRVPD